MLKELQTKYKDLAIIGISLDQDAQALQNAVASRTISWPQIRDGREGPIAKLFNVKGTPTYYVIDRSGKIAAKDIPGKKLGEVVAEVLRK